MQELYPAVQGFKFAGAILGFTTGILVTPVQAAFNGGKRAVKIGALASDIAIQKLQNRLHHNRHRTASAEDATIGDMIVDDVADKVETMSGQGWEARIRTYSNGVHTAVVIAKTKAMKKVLGANRQILVERGSGAEKRLKAQVHALVQGYRTSQAATSERIEAERHRRAKSAADTTAAKPEQSATETKLEKRGDKVAGTFLTAGVDTRTDGERKFDQFYVDLAIEGATTRFWGADLERALKAAGNPAKGAPIQVMHKGRIQAGAGHKNLYEIRVL